MKRSVFAKLTMAERFGDDRYGGHLESFADALCTLGYAPYSVNQYVRESDLFCFWLQSNELTLQSLTCATIKRYLTSEPEFTQSKSTGKRRVQTQPAILAFSQHLRKLGALEGEATEASQPDSPIGLWLSSYRNHMHRVRGLSPSTQSLYLRFVARFLKQQFKDGACDWTSLSADCVANFVRSESAARKGCGPQNVVSSIRSFLRFLISENLVSPALQNAIPGRKRYPQAPPQRLSEAELTHLLSAANDGSAIGKRNFAILMLLSQLGLRAGEVRCLQLGDIDWRAGSILIRAGKTHSQRRLPLPRAVAKAILSYICDVRPKSLYREIFLDISAPFHPLQKSPAITSIVKCMLKRIGLERHRSGAHLLRHSMATNLVNRGASFLEIADLLGHNSLRSTGAYAKLDFQKLAAISLPWMEVRNDAN
jgi:site-specific recombinase XerD